MKALMISTAAAAALLTLPMAASAQNMDVKGYGSVGYSQGDYDGGADLGTIQGRLGARFGQYVGVEGEIGLGVRDDDTWVGGVKADNSVKHQMGLYGVGFLPVGENADLYARVGYGETKAQQEIAGDPRNDTTHSWNYGAGGQYLPDGKNGVRVDYTRHEFKDDKGKADVWSVGYVHKF